MRFVLSVNSCVYSMCHVPCAADAASQSQSDNTSSTLQLEDSSVRKEKVTTFVLLLNGTVIWMFTKNENPLDDYSVNSSFLFKCPWENIKTQAKCKTWSKHPAKASAVVLSIKLYPISPMKTWSPEIRTSTLSWELHSGDTPVTNLLSEWTETFLLLL